MSAKTKNTKAAGSKTKKAITKTKPVAKTHEEMAIELKNLLVSTFDGIQENFESLDLRTKNLWSSINTTDEFADRLSRATTVSARLSLVAIVISVASTITTIVTHAK